jgi:dihydroneopterin aldolase
MHRDVIAIRGLEVDCVVGVHPHERDTSQPLSVDVSMCLDTEAAGATERITRTIDYQQAAAQIVFLLQSCRFRLLETAAHAIARHLLAPPLPDENRPQVASVRIRLSKPAALDGRAVPSLEIERDASWVTMAHEVRPFGTVDVIHETKDAGIYRLNVAPGQRIPLHVHRRMQESEMVLGEGLRCNGRAVAPGTIHRWPHDAPHTYENPTDRTVSILCVDAPPFIESDEIPVEGVPADVTPDGPWPPEGAR